MYNYFRTTLYALKREYGQPVDFYEVVSATPNLETGRKTVAKTKTAVRRAVVLPEKISQRLAATLATVDTGRNFNYGGVLKQGRHLVIVDRRDITGVKVDSYAVIKHQRYSVLKVDDYQDAYLVTLATVKEHPVEEFLDGFASSRLNLTQTPSAVKV